MQRTTAKNKQKQSHTTCKGDYIADIFEAINKDYASDGDQLTAYFNDNPHLDVYCSVCFINRISLLKIISYTENFEMSWLYTLYTDWR